MGSDQHQGRESLTIAIDEIHLDVTHDLGVDPGLQKDGVEAHLQELLAANPGFLLVEGLRLVRREYPTDIGPVDLFCRDAEGRAVAVEIKRRGEIDGVEQLARYVERLDLDGRLRPVRGLLAAQQIKPQAQVMAASRGIQCVEVDYDDLRAAGTGRLTLLGEAMGGSRLGRSTLSGGKCAHPKGGTLQRVGGRASRSAVGPAGPSRMPSAAGLEAGRDARRAGAAGSRVSLFWVGSRLGRSTLSGGKCLLARATSLHNVELPLIYAGVPAAERSERAKAALTAVGMGDRMSHKPNELSGGQRQRVAVARALVNNPAIILADEPTGNLDSATGNEIMALFDRLHSEGNTIVLVTHEHDIAEYAHRIIYIKDGVVERDEVKEGR